MKKINLFSHLVERLPNGANAPVLQHRAVLARDPRCQIFLKVEQPLVAFSAINIIIISKLFYLNWRANEKN